MKNNVMVEMLEAEGFTAFEDENDPAQRMQEFCNSAGHLDGLVLLRRDFKFATGDATHASVPVDTVRGRAYFAWWQNARYPIKNRRAPYPQRHHRHDPHRGSQNLKGALPYEGHHLSLLPPGVQLLAGAR